MAAIAEIAVRLAFGERRIGKQRGAKRLQRQADAELLGHVGFAGIVQIGLHRAGAQHHIEPELAHLRHLLQHDGIAPLGHDGQLGAGGDRIETQAEEAQPQLGAHLQALLQMPAGFRAGLVQGFQRRAGQLELAGRLQTDAAIGTRKGYHIAAFHNRLPTEAGEGSEQVADAARLVVGRCPAIFGAEHEFLVLGADPPLFARLFAGFEQADHVGLALDESAIPQGFCPVAHASRLSDPQAHAPDGFECGSIRCQRLELRDGGNRCGIGAQDVRAER